jgi:uncharacterized protein
MVIAHLGHPWEDETAVLVRKQPNVFTDVSACHTRPFRLHQKLMTFLEYDVLNKILFGTDFPFFNVEQTVSGLRQINRYAKKYSLPLIPEEGINDIIHENAWKVFKKSVT